MSKKKNILVIAIVVAIVVILLFNIIAIFNAGKVTILDENGVIEENDFKIVVDDHYIGDFKRPEGLNYTFDKYLAVDFSITNLDDDAKKFHAFNHFFIDDDSGKVKPFVIDENEKKFSKELQPNEVFEITLVFPVDDAKKYVVYYNKSLKDEDDLVLGFELTGTDLETKKVDTTVDHNTPDFLEESEDDLESDLDEAEDDLDEAEDDLDETENILEENNE